MWMVHYGQPAHPITSMKHHILSLFTLAALSAGMPMANAELPPYVYEQRKAAAPEHLLLKVLSAEVVKAEDNGTTSATVKATAEVTSVMRSKSGLKAGQSITISYTTITERPQGWVGPSSPGVLQKDAHVSAWLARSDDGSYAPILGGQSFGKP